MPRRGAAGWHFVDLRGVFDADPDALFCPDDVWHPNAEGRRRVPLHLAKRLVEQNVLPQD